MTGRGNGSLLRIVGAAGGGRTSLAVSKAASILASDDRRLVMIDTLGHGVCSAIDAHDLRERSVFKFETAANQILAVARHLIASGGVGCVVLDDLPGLDFGPSLDPWARAKAMSVFTQSLTSIALAFDCSLILVARASDFGRRAPLGFRDEFIPDKRAA